jgi:hypothetical protein
LARQIARLGDLLMADNPRAPSIIIATPSAGLWRESMGVCAVGMAGLTGAVGIRIDAIGATGAYTETNRNNIVNAVLARPEHIDGIMWVDSDMRFPPDALLRLMGRGMDICGASYRERQEPYRFLGCFDDDDDRHAMEPGLHKMKRLPGGFILVKTEVYRRLDPPWYKLDEQGYRDDYYFCNLAREAGYDVWGDMDLTPHIVHRGEQDVGWFVEGEAVARRDDDPRWKIFEKPPRTRPADLGGGFYSRPSEKVA